MHEQEIKNLNSALKGEHMAIEIYDYYIKDTTDEIKKEKLMSIQQQHKNHAQKIATRIQELGGKPINHAGLAGAVSGLKHQLHLNKHTDKDILTKAIDGEKFGMQEIKKLVDEIKNSDSRILIKDIMNQNKLMIDDLINFQR